MGGGQNTYNPLKSKGRNKKIITIIIFLILIVVSISFALFNPSINLLGRRNIKISKCELDINFKESDELMLISKYPISTRQALEGDYKPKTVTITNNSTCDMAYYKLTIKDLVNSSINKDVIQYHVVDKQNTMTYKLGDITGDNLITAADTSDIIRYLKDEPSIFNQESSAKYAGDVDNDGKITTNDTDLIQKYAASIVSTFPAGAPLEEKTTTKEIINVNPDTFLIENSIEKGQTHEYEIMMWISNTATNTDLYVNGDATKPIEYKYALNIEASDEETKAKNYVSNIRVIIEDYYSYDEWDDKTYTKITPITDYNFTNTKEPTILSAIAKFCDDNGYEYKYQVYDYNNKKAFLIEKLGNLSLDMSNNTLAIFYSVIRKDTNNKYYLIDKTNEYTLVADINTYINDHLDFVLQDNDIVYIIYNLYSSKDETIQNKIDELNNAT